MVVDASQFFAWMTGFLWVFIRVGSMMMISPVFSGRMVSAKIRLIVALSVTIPVSMTVQPVSGVDIMSIDGIILVIREMIIGFSIGFIVQMIFSALMIAGDAIGMSMGLGFASMIDPMSGGSTVIVSQFFVVLCTLIFLALDGHAMMIMMVAESFRWMPVGGEFYGPDQFKSITALGVTMFAGGLLIALPAILALKVTNVAIGVVSRAATQMNIFSVGFPVMLLIGIVVLSHLVTYMPLSMSSMMQASFEYIPVLMGAE